MAYPARGVLGGDGHAARQAQPGAALGFRSAPLGGLGEVETMRGTGNGSPRLHRNRAHSDAGARRATRSSASTAISTSAAPSRRAARCRNVATILKDIRDVEVGRPAGLRRGAASGGAVERSARRLPPRDHDHSINFEGTMRVARAAKAAGVAALRVLLVLLELRRQSGPDFIDETGAFNPVTPYGESKVQLGAGAGRACRRQLLPDLPALAPRPMG